MKDQWFKSNVDLRLLSESLGRYFVDNNFETKLEEVGSCFKIEAANPQFKVKVRVFGVPDDFVVEFVPSKKTRGFSSVGMILGYLTSAFGGGGLVVMDARVQEAVGVFEDLFWEYVDKQVAELGGSAR